MSDAQYLRKLEMALKAIAKVPVGSKKTGALQACARLALER